MTDVEVRTVPTASENMLKKSSNSGLPLPLRMKGKGSRVRSKSESYHIRGRGNEVGNSDKPINGVVMVRAAKEKNDRKPKNMKGNGNPKKGGAGGKGTWGKAGQIYDSEEFDDPDDPNYDPDNVRTVDVVLHEIPSDLTSPEFDKLATPIFLEYYNHLMTWEVAASLSELNITHLKHRVVYLAISLAMEKKGGQRELTSVLLSALYGDKVLNASDFEFGYQSLMNSLADLKLDTPDAAVVLGQFMARSVADDCLRPCYIKEHLERACDDARVSLERAHRLLGMKHGIVRLDTIWGYGGGIRPVKMLVKEIALLIKEYLSSNDFKEAERCITDLDVPHFHHEIVYEAVVIAIEDGSHKTTATIVSLLKHLFGDNIITEDQMNAGFERIFVSMDDLVLDTPRAFKHMDTVLEMCCRADIIPLWLRQKAPSRGRKRFVSEGDFSMSTKSLMVNRNGCAADHIDENVAH